MTKEDKMMGKIVKGLYTLKNRLMSQIHYPMVLHQSFMAIVGLLIVLFSVIFAILFWQFVSLVSIGLIATIIFVSLLTIENVADFFSER